MWYSLLDSLFSHSIQLVSYEISGAASLVIYYSFINFQDIDMKHRSKVIEQGAELIASKMKMQKLREMWPNLDPEVMRIRAN